MMKRGKRAGLKSAPILLCLFFAVGLEAREVELPAIKVVGSADPAGHHEISGKICKKGKQLQKYRNTPKK